MDLTWQPHLCLVPSRHHGCFQGSDPWCGSCALYGQSQWKTGKFFLLAPEPSWRIQGLG